MAGNDYGQIVIGGRTFKIVNANETQSHRTYKMSDVKRVNGMYELLDMICSSTD